MKQYHRYRMDFKSKWLDWSAVCIGGAMFLLAVHYLGFQYLTKPMMLIWNLWIPMIFGIVYIVLLRGIRLNAPGVYAILGALVCFWLLIGVFGTGNVLRIILALIAYVFSAGMLILCTGGYLPGRLPAAICFGVILAVRLVFFDLGKISGADWILELADLGFIGFLMFLPMCMTPGKPVKEEIIAE